MTTEDKEILRWYLKGFHDEMNGTTTIESDNPELNIAYKVGADHADLGIDIEYDVKFIKDEMKEWN